MPPETAQTPPPPPADATASTEPGAALKGAARKPVAKGSPKWDEQCVVFLRQTRDGRLKQQHPATSMRCIQRLLDADGTLLYKHSTDFLAAANEFVSMVDPHSADEALALYSLAARGSPEASNQAPVTGSPHPATPLIHTPPSGATKDRLAAPTEASTQLTHESKASSQPINEYSPPSSTAKPLQQSLADHVMVDYVDPSKRYLTRLYTPCFRFAQNYAEGLRSGAAFPILRRYWDAVVVEGRPFQIGSQVIDKWRSWSGYPKQPPN
ncbi:hypothetical protein BC830DRAFT_1155674 [Chytriomyces sp. MP71]|nr:hypothetical protein BC830DRAFT_1155674 [Chytriomyces sp. MP71]